MKTEQGPDQRNVVEAVHEALRTDARLVAVSANVTLSYADDMLSLEGEVEDIARKKIALHRAAAVDGVRWVVDRLRVRPSEHMEDGAILDHVCDALLQEPALSECAVIRESKGRDEVLREPQNRRGYIRVVVEDGVVTLDGDLPTREHKRIAGVLAGTSSMAWVCCPERTTRTKSWRMQFASSWRRTPSSTPHS